MTTPTLYEQTGLSVHWADPLILADRSAYQHRITDDLDDYGHTISAYGGYDEAEISISGDIDFVEDWIANGIGRHVVAYNAGGQVVWAGFVNQMQVGVGSLNVTYGPLMDIANRTSCVYSLLDTTTNPPTVGARTVTAIIQNAISQALYGIWDKTIIIGQTTATDALQARNTFQQENKRPVASQQLSLGGSSASKVSVTLSCKGYFNWLQAYIYNQVAISGTTTLSAKMLAILAADPNAALSTDYTGIATNGILVPAYENEDMIANSLITGLVALGDATDARYLFGVYDDQKAIYKAAPTTAYYEQRLSDQAQNVRRYAAGSIVDYWDVRPGKWLFFNDFLVGKITDTSDLRSDPRYMFIESAQYRAPSQLQLLGGKTDRLPQMLARFGLGGTSA